ncbi:MAG TPA: acyltransferase, partial [Pirellulales bacterium]|nr:acyltransferase [Pirellulales bacterium]
MTNDQHRILELDALRGLAALAVVSFHFTCRFDGLFGHATPLRFSVPLGEYGVDFFFILSGFVILMTLDRTASAGEFAVGRFARLYPAYWAAAALTFAVVQCCGLPGQAVSVGEAVVNATMLQHLLGAPHIDGAYWSLEVELLFYGAILALDRAGALRVTHWPATLAIWLALATAAQFAVNQPPPATLMEPTWPFGLVTKLQTALSLKYLHLFAIGIVLYRVRCAGGRSRVAWLILIWCVELQVLADSWLAAGLVVLMTVVLRAAVDGR